MPKRVDNNHAEIVQALRAMGAKVLDLHTLGRGAPDLLVCWRGHLALFEIKSADGQLTLDEKTFMLSWPVMVVRNVAQAQEMLEALEEDWEL